MCFGHLYPCVCMLMELSERSIRNQIFYISHFLWRSWVTHSSLFSPSFSFFHPLTLPFCGSSQLINRSTFFSYQWTCLCSCSQSQFELCPLFFSDRTLSAPPPQAPSVWRPGHVRTLGPNLFHQLHLRFLPSLRDDVTSGTICQNTWYLYVLITRALLIEMHNLT